MTEIIIPRKKQTAATSTAASGRRLPRPVMPALIIASTIAGPSSRSGCQASEIRLAKIESEAR